MSSQSMSDSDSQSGEVEELVSQINSTNFWGWYRERERTRNIQNGQSYFNGPSPIPEPERHSPSRLLSCHRQTYYHHHNAPKETDKPLGIFWFGSKFETEIAVPFLRDLTGSDQYVQNSIWIDFTTEVNEDELRFKGETDPVIVDAEGNPCLLTEIKTTSSVTYLDAPKQQHKAQAHVYLRGLSEKYDRDLTDAVILYGTRDTLSFRAFHITFDPEFWRDSVLDWGGQNTAYRQDGNLPPQSPYFDWECEYCDYRERCGKGETHYEDLGPVGLLSEIDYSKDNLAEYVEAHSAAKLTPTLARRFPKLAETYGVYDWICPVCSATHGWDEIELGAHPSEPPICPRCSSKGRGPIQLSEPAPTAQIGEKYSAVGDDGVDHD